MVFLLRVDVSLVMIIFKRGHPFQSKVGVGSLENHFFMRPRLAGPKLIKSIYIFI